MAQPSVAQYFNTRKRSAVDDIKVDNPKKVLLLNQDKTNQITKIGLHGSKISVTSEPKIIVQKSETHSKATKSTNLEQQNVAKRVIKAPKKRIKGGSNQDIQNFLNNMKNIERCVTPPNPCEQDVNKELKEIKKKICRSSKLKELKASISRFKESAEQLKAIEKKTADLSSSPQLKTFKSIEFEVTVSPQKVQSPEKAYLSPKKEPSVRRNLLNALSPKKNLFSTIDSSSKETLETLPKQGLQLPFKYRTLNEIFRAIDTISQILFNRKELITFKKLKPAVEEMLKRNLYEKHLSQIKSIYPEAYNFHQEKVKVFGSGTREEKWELVLIPNITTEGMTSQILLDRRRKLTDILIDKVKEYHNEFLLSLTPPIIIAKDKIARWHPEFDLEKVPEIELAPLPEPPFEEKFTTGKEVLEKARQMFNCNTRMEQALLRLKEARKNVPVTSEEPLIQEIPTLKGIPKALLEKVRQKQAAKALISMTRSVDKEKEVQLYSRLPEIARLTRNLFVTEKKSVLELDFVMEKLRNSYRCSLNNAEMENHLKAISNAVPGWLVFHKLRSSVFLKLVKNADLSQVLSKLEKLSREKNDS